jgi:hypothetical protein
MQSGEFKTFWSFCGDARANLRITDLGHVRVKRQDAMMQRGKTPDKPILLANAPINLQDGYKAAS